MIWRGVRYCIKCLLNCKGKDGIKGDRKRAMGKRVQYGVGEQEEIALPLPPTPHNRNTDIPLRDDVIKGVCYAVATINY